MAENNNKQENIILCGANSYQQKYYFNEKFKLLPENIKKELQIMCVLFTEDVGGILFLEFTPEGNLEFRVEAEDQDYLFDEIGSGLKIRQYQREKKELLESLELFYRVVFRGDKLEDQLEKEQAELEARRAQGEAGKKSLLNNNDPNFVNPKEKLYDKFPLSVHQMDIIIGVLFALIVLFLVLGMTHTSFFGLFGG